jgi:chromosome segregation ATPase
MDLEAALDGLKAENDKLQAEIGKGPGSVIDEASVRAEVEQAFRERIAYKEGEIEAVNTKLARISQANIEYKTRCDRLENNNAELSQECEQNRSKLQSLELELEMTKLTSERDLEQLVDQQRTISEERNAITEDKERLEDRLALLQRDHAAFVAQSDSQVK